MKSFEAELGSAARARYEERQYREDKIGGLTGAEHAALDKIDTTGISFESPEDEAKRIAKARQNEGSLDELQVSEETLRRQGSVAGANSHPSRVNEFSGSATEYFASGPKDARIESDAMATLRIQNPEKFERIAALKRSRVSRQADIMNLKQQIALQQDAAMRAAQEKVLMQFERELETVEQELNELSPE